MTTERSVIRRKFPAAYSGRREKALCFGVPTARRYISLNGLHRSPRAKRSDCAAELHAELTEMVVRVEVRPSQPRRFRHSAKYGMELALEAAAPIGRDLLKQSFKL